MDYQALARELVRQLRGRRSQLALSRRLGYRSNVVYSWESGRRQPRAAEFLRMLVLLGIDLDASWRRFYSRPPGWLGRIDTATPQGVAWVLSDLRGRTPLEELAEQAGTSRYTISRWLSGKTEPRLPDFLRIFDVMSLRLLDWVTGFIDVDGLPSAHAAWQRLEDQRRAALDTPWTQAVLRALELTDYQALAAHEDGWIARRLGIDERDERSCLQRLQRAGQIRWIDGKWRLEAVMTVDTRLTAEDGRRLKAFWAEQGMAQLKAGSDGLFSYNVFGISRADLERLRKLHLAYFRELRSLIAQSGSTERVAVLNLQLFALDPGPGGPPAADA